VPCLVCLSGVVQPDCGASVYGPPHPGFQAEPAQEIRKGEGGAAAAVGPAAVVAQELPAAVVAAAVLMQAVDGEASQQQRR
jgi:hypothetical protein